MRPLSLLIPIALLTACSVQRPRAALPGENQVASQGYIDLQAGWRIKVLTPILRSGKFVLDAPYQIDGLTIAMHAGADYIGFQNAWFSVRSRTGGLIHISFLTAEDTRNGVTTQDARPILQPFQTPFKSYAARLLFQLRRSSADHSMAFLAAPTQAALDVLTRAVKADPAQCRASATALCRVIPQGIAIVPEAGSNETGWRPVV